MISKTKQFFTHFVIGLGLLPLLLGCEKKLVQDLKGPLTFEVAFDNFNAGTPSSPLPFSREGIPVTFSVRAIDLNGETATWFDGDVALSAAPRGKLGLGQPKTLRLTAGVATNASRTVERVHGRTGLWVEDVGTNESKGSFAVGLSPHLYVDNPFLGDIQQTDSTGTSLLKGDFVHINFEGRRAIVTGLTKDGFYVTDVEDPNDTFNALYVYTHSLPKNVSPGVEILALSGTVEEYYGFTELGFPSYQTGNTYEIPTPVVITTEMLADDLEMEKRESRLVQIPQGTVCPIGSDFERYGQWAINIDPSETCDSSSSRVNIVSTYTVEWFDPGEYTGKTVKSITGNLRQHTSASPMWIVYTRDESDIVLE